MRGRPAERLWLWLPPAASCWADVGMTMLAQSGRYWAGDYAAVDEFNPAARILLVFHPLAFVAAAAAWCVALGAGLILCNRNLAVAGAFLVTFCHAVAAAGWMVRLWGVAGAAAGLVLLLLTERLLAFASRRSGAAAVVRIPPPESPLAA